jgi:hypothetical protein
VSRCRVLSRPWAALPAYTDADCEAQSAVEKAIADETGPDPLAAARKPPNCGA